MRRLRLSLLIMALPAALWGEKAGTFTNTDRTVHVSHKAVDPPGEARSDLDIFLDFARRMDFRDRDGQPLVKWDDTSMQTSYANVCNVSSTREEVVLAFGVNNVWERAQANIQVQLTSRRSPVVGSAGSGGKPCWASKG